MEKKKTRTIEGWVRRTDQIVFDSSGVICIEVFKRKEEKEKWQGCDWPPRKVKLIVEEP